MEKGITLLELIICLAIISAIGAVSAPPLKKFIAEQSVTSDVNLLVNVINTARSKSITQKVPIQICGIQPDNSCSRNWRKLIVSEPDSKTVLYTQSLNNSYEKVYWSAFQRKPGLTMMPNGFTGHQNGTLYLCHKNYPSLHRALIVAKSGKITITQSSKKIQKQCSY
ncbi:GspH/FimT family pseudopilin [Kangiella sediminilitoris]|uniref:Type II secretion system protein H n=1 Tax=Kangiella sediminilitoris TaxID=1144748 RepID=A0A1B3BB46_9GAMM|nr:GspH/FimT family pseudopilin [Kangiella sediminilitoris]AOE49994.1 Tfp pilus assembly protein FimT [Kangiella sediminilitoris]